MYDENINKVRYEKGDLILLKNETANKLDTLYNGPFIVIKDKEPKAKIIKNHKEEVIHKNRKKIITSKRKKNYRIFLIYKYVCITFFLFFYPCGVVC